MRALAVVSCLLGLYSSAAAERESAPAPAKKCVPVPVAAAAAKKLKAPKCHKPAAKVQKVVRDAVVKDFHVTKTGGRADVSFPCDGLGPKIREITVEGGGGHGGSLNLWIAQRVGTDWDVHGLLYREGKTAKVLTATGKVALPDLEAVRAGVSAKIKEVAPPPPKNGMYGISGSSSSRDFHILIRLVDDDGRVVEKQYTGYASSSDQNDYLGLEAALAALAPMTDLADKATEQPAPSDDDRAFFARQFNAAIPRFEDDFYWWVMERFVGMARVVGSPAVIDGLLTRLTLVKNDRSHTDARTDALEALAKITGWDAREGGKKTDEQAAASYRAECRP